MLVEVAALELGPAGIRVNAVGPGLVRTALTEAAFILPSVVDEYEENTPLGAPRPARRTWPAWWPSWPPTRPPSCRARCYLVDGGAHTMRYPDILARMAEFGG